MDITASLPDHGAIIRAVLDGFVQAAMVEIGAGVVQPFPYQHHVSFIPEQGTEAWLLPHQVLRAGGGDCEDLAIWTCAGYRITGQDPGATCDIVQISADNLHCVVVHSDGTVEDPSAVIKQRQPRSTAKLGAGPSDTIVRDHRSSSTIAKAAAAGDPVAAYMAAHGTSTLAISPTATTFINRLSPQARANLFSDPLAAAQHNQAQAIMESASVERRSITNPKFGRATESSMVDPNDPNFTPVTDDGAGGGHWERSSINNGGIDPLTGQLAASEPGYDPTDPYGAYGGSGGIDPYGGYGDPSMYGGMYGSPYGFDQGGYAGVGMAAFNPYLNPAAFSPATQFDPSEGYAGYGSSVDHIPTYFDIMGMDQQDQQMPPYFGPGADAYGGDDLGIDPGSVIDINDGT